MKLLAIDTSGPLCSVALLDLGTMKFIFSRSDDLGRGHAEHLMPMLEEEMIGAGIEWAQITRIAVVHGPGSFTGLRVGIAAARGFALARDIPCDGVSVFEALSQHYGSAQNLACVLDARREQVWMQCFGENGPVTKPAAYDVTTFVTAVPEGTSRLAGSGANLLSDDDAKKFTILGAEFSPPIEAVALYAASSEPSDTMPKPLYLREPDAKPQHTTKDGAS